MPAKNTYYSESTEGKIRELKEEFGFSRAKAVRVGIDLLHVLKRCSDKEKAVELIVSIDKIMGWV